MKKKLILKKIYLKKIFRVIFWVPMGLLNQKISPFGPAVWPAIADIYIYERRALLYKNINQL